MKKITVPDNDDLHNLSSLQRSLKNTAATIIEDVCKKKLMEAGFCTSRMNTKLGLCASYRQAHLAAAALKRLFKNRLSKIYPHVVYTSRASESDTYKSVFTTDILVPMYAYTGNIPSATVQKTGIPHVQSFRADAVSTVFSRYIARMNRLARRHQIPVMFTKQERVATLSVASSLDNTVASAHQLETLQQLFRLADGETSELVGTLPKVLLISISVYLVDHVFSCRPESQVRGYLTSLPAEAVASGDLRTIAAEIEKRFNVDVFASDNWTYVNLCSESPNADVPYSNAVPKFDRLYFYLDELMTCFKTLKRRSLFFAEAHHVN
jgi:hypothetical protein